MRTCNDIECYRGCKAALVVFLYIVYEIQINEKTKPGVSVYADGCDYHGAARGAEDAGRATDAADIS
jgi:hypothetical protein